MRPTSKEYAKKLLELIHREIVSPLHLMEVCGTHTVAIARSGIRSLLPPELKLISGPGCPVCVTDNTDLDPVLELSRRPGVIMATYGDMLRVPGSHGSLQEEKGNGADIRVVYSTLDAVELARTNPDREVVFLGIGFETTIPTAAAALEMAAVEKLRNFSIVSMHKLVPPALKALLEDPDVRIDGFINPGHVCTILGVEPFRFIPEQYRRPCVITGFEPADILEGILMIIRQHRTENWAVEIQYRRAVQPQGNPVAREYIEKYFTPVDAVWRGIGVIPGSGLELKEAYSDWNARKKFGLKPAASRPKTACACGEILKGIKLPSDCPLFGKACTPLRPVGPCMVSTEGSCAAYYRFSPQREGVQA